MQRCRGAVPGSGCRLDNYVQSDVQHPEYASLIPQLILDRYDPCAFNAAMVILTLKKSPPVQAWGNAAATGYTWVTRHTSVDEMVVGLTSMMFMNFYERNALDREYEFH